MARKALWTGIRDQLEHDIASGRYQACDKLPTEADLSTRFGVNRHTVRRALAELAERGLVQARRGAGVFVASTPTDYPIGERVRFHQNLLATGRTPRKKMLLLEIRTADNKERDALDLEDGAKVQVCEGLSYAEDIPIALFRSVFPETVAPKLLETLRTETSITRALTRHGIEDYTRAWTRVTAKAASPTISAHLMIAQGNPVLRTTSLNVDSERRPIEFGKTWFAADRVTLTIAAEDQASAPSSRPRSR